MRPARLLGVALGALLLASLASEARAQDEGLSVEAALDLAIANNLDLARANLQVTRSEVLARGELSVLSPIIQLETNYTHSDQPTRGLLENGLRISDVFNMSATGSKRLRWGTDVSVQLEAQRLRSAQPFTLPGGMRDVNVIGPQWSETLSLNISQPLLRGFGEELNLLSQALARQQVDTAELSREQSVSQVTLDVLEAYYELFFANTEVVNRRNQIALAEEQREATRALVASGQLAESELDVIEQRLVVLEESLLVAENDQLNRQETLLRLLGDPPSGGAPLQATSRPTGDAIPLADAELVRVSTSQNLELRLLKEQIQTQRLNMITSRDAVRPDLDLLMQISQQGLSEDGLSDASEQVFTFDAGTAFIGLSFSMPLDNGRAEAQYEADRLQLQELEIQHEATERQVTDSVRAAARLMRLNQKRVDLGERTVELARRGLAAEEARFRAGRSTNQSVIQFQEELQQAQSRALRSRVDLIVSVLRVRHLTGTLLEQYGIEVEPGG